MTEFLRVGWQAKILDRRKSSVRLEFPTLPGGARSAKSHSFESHAGIFVRVDFCEGDSRFLEAPFYGSTRIADNSLATSLI